MKKAPILLLAVSCTFLLSCNQNTASDTSAAEKEEAPIIVEESEEEKTVDTDALITEIKQQREAIEAGLAEPVEVSTANLRAKVKQKWEKIHFYTQEGEVVRIKTYPYHNISNRTEEFYLNEGSLILAVIEDDGRGEKGKPLAEMDKLYYFHQGELLKEEHHSGEEEYSIKDSDAEELLEEVKEYMEIYQKQV